MAKMVAATDFEAYFQQVMGSEGVPGGFGGYASVIIALLSLRHSGPSQPPVVARAQPASAPSQPLGVARAQNEMP